MIQSADKAKCNSLRFARRIVYCYHTLDELPAAKNLQSERPGGLHLGFGSSSNARVEGFVYGYHDYTWYDNGMRSFHNWPDTSNESIDPGQGGVLLHR